MEKYKIFPIGRETSASGGYGVFIEGSTIFDSTLRSIEDYAGTNSPLQLSTSQIGMAFSGVTNPIVWRANSSLADYSGWHQLDGTYRLLTKDNAPLFINNANGIYIQNGLGSGGRTSIDGNGNWNIGGAFTNTARFHVRGDGTNSIARFEDNAGLKILEITQAGFLNVSNASVVVGLYAIDNNLAANKNGFGIGFTNVMQNGNSYYFTTALSKNATSGTSTLIKTAETFAASAGSANYRHLDVGYTINNSGAQLGTATGIFLNATETALNGMNHNLMDLQVGGVSMVKITASGDYLGSNSIYLTGTNRFVSATYFRGQNAFFRLSEGGANGTALLTDSTGNSFNRLQFGGTSNLFPALKRNGTALEVKLADDVSGFADLASRSISANFGLIGVTSISSLLPSAIFQIDSTNRGFLPPRMTTAQKNAISTPATGLVVFDTDLGKLCVFSTTWQTITSV